MGFACRDFLTSLMIWAWRHQLHPASDLILTNLCIELVIFCQGVASFPRSSGGDRILISHGPRLCHGSLSSCDISCHLVITCHHPDIRQPAAKLVCVLEKRGNCKPVTDCWLSKAIWPGDHRLIMQRILNFNPDLNSIYLRGKSNFVKNIFRSRQNLKWIMSAWSPNLDWPCALGVFLLSSGWLHGLGGRVGEFLKQIVPPIRLMSR